MININDNKKYIWGTNFMHVTNIIYKHYCFDTIIVIYKHAYYTILLKSLHKSHSQNFISMTEKFIIIIFFILSYLSIIFKNLSTKIFK